MTLTLAHRYTPKGMSAFGAAIAMLRRMAATQDDGTRADARPGPARRRAIRLEAVDAVAHFCRESGLPPFLVRDDVPLPRTQVREHFTRRIMGQPEAIDRLVDLVAIIKAGLTEPTRPLGSFLFVGPHRRGQDRECQGPGRVRVRRREPFAALRHVGVFSSAASVTRFVGDERQEGVLVAAVRRSPFTVILLDEIEKAHPAVYDVLLQVLGEARLTDPRGRVADFRNCVILMSSNLGVDSYRAGAGFGEDDLGGLAAHFEAEVRRFFRPEFVNRLDRVVSFSPLAHAAIQHITGRELAKLRAREGIADARSASSLTSPCRTGWPRAGSRPSTARARSSARSSDNSRSRSRCTSRNTATPRCGWRWPRMRSSSPPVRLRPQQPDAQGPPPISLRDTLAEVRRTRYQCQRWRASGVYQQIVRSLDLVDRLGAQQHFWVDHERATARMGRAEELRDITRRFDDLYEHLCSFEDLGFEALADAAASISPRCKPSCATP